jgi:hypothetical protein
MRESDRVQRWRQRRLSKDFEALPETTETWSRIAMIHLMVWRLAARACPFQTGADSLPLP